MNDKKASRMALPSLMRIRTLSIFSLVKILLVSILAGFAGSILAWTILPAAHIAEPAEGLEIQAGHIETLQARVDALEDHRTANRAAFADHGHQDDPMVQENAQAIAALSTRLDKIAVFPFPSAAPDDPVPSGSDQNISQLQSDVKTLNQQLATRITSPHHNPNSPLYPIPQNAEQKHWF